MILCVQVCINVHFKTVLRLDIIGSSFSHMCCVCKKISDLILIILLNTLSHVCSNVAPRHKKGKH